MPKKKQPEHLKKGSSRIGRITPRELQLLDYYYGVSNFNKSDALRRLGKRNGEPLSQPNDNLAVFNRPAVKAEMERREALIRERYEVSYERVVDEIAKIAYSHLGDVLQINEDGEMYINLHEASAHSLAALGEVTVESYVEGRGEDAQVVKRVKVKPWNKMAALEALMRHAGLSKEKVPVLGVELVDRIRAGRDRLAKGEEARGHGELIPEHLRLEDDVT